MGSALVSMKFTFKGVEEFEMADQWLFEAGAAGFSAGSGSFASDCDERYSEYPLVIVPIQHVRPPRRDAGVRWFDRVRMVSILRGMASGCVLPAIAVRESRDSSDRRYIVYDGFHRFYASVALGFVNVPVSVLPPDDTPAQTLIAFDSNVLTAFLSANASGDVPPAEDALASIRLFFYAPKLVILPTVTREAERIPREDDRREHLTWVWYHFHEALLERDADNIDARSRAFLADHPDIDDCRLVAEAEVAGVDVLASFDKRLARRLCSATKVRLLSPALALATLAIEPGADPVRRPGDGHPLEHLSWWML